MWSFLDGLIDWLIWPRFQLCLWGGFAVGIVLTAKIPAEPWNMILGAAACLMLWVVGWRWEARAGG